MTGAGDWEQALAVRYLNRFQTIDAVVCGVVVCGKISRVHCSYLTWGIWCNLSSTLTVAIALQLAGSLLMASGVKLTWKR